MIHNHQQLQRDGVKERMNEGRRKKYSVVHIYACMIQVLSRNSEHDTLPLYLIDAFCILLDNI